MPIHFNDDIESQDMNIDGTPTRTLRAQPERGVIDIIDQTRLPHALHWVRVATLDEAAHAIRAMQVRGAPLIGVTAAYGLAIALASDTSDARLQHAAALLRSTRPTAVNLHWALARMENALSTLPPDERLAAAWAEAAAIAEEDVAQNAAIGQHGLGMGGRRLRPDSERHQRRAGRIWIGVPRRTVIAAANMLRSRRGFTLH